MNSKFKRKNNVLSYFWTDSRILPLVTFNFRLTDSRIRGFGLLLLFSCQNAERTANSATVSPSPFTPIGVQSFKNGSLGSPPWPNLADQGGCWFNFWIARKRRPIFYQKSSHFLNTFGSPKKASHFFSEIVPFFKYFWIAKKGVPFFPRNPVLNIFGSIFFKMDSSSKPCHAAFR